MTNKQFRDFKHLMKFNSRYTQANFNPSDVGGAAAARTNLLVLASKDICTSSFPQQQQQLERQQPEQSPSAEEHKAM